MSKGHVSKGESEREREREREREIHHCHSADVASLSAGFLLEGHAFPFPITFPFHSFCFSHTFLFPRSIGVGPSSHAYSLANN